jgi:hypothetical protein
MNDPRQIWNDIERLALAGRLEDALALLRQVDQEQLASDAEELGIAGGYALAQQAALDALERGEE